MFHLDSDLLSQSHDPVSNSLTEPRWFVGSMKHIDFGSTFVQKLKTSVCSKRNKQYYVSVITSVHFSVGFKRCVLQPKKNFSLNKKNLIIFQKLYFFSYQNL